MGTKTAVCQYLTLTDAAARLGVEPWQVRRLHERGILPEPPRLGRNRLYTEADLDTLRQALQEAGYLKTEVA